MLYHVSTFYNLVKRYNYLDSAMVMVLVQNEVDCEVIPFQVKSKTMKVVFFTKHAALRCRGKD